MKREAISLHPSYGFHPHHSHLDLSWIIAAEKSPLRIAGSQNQTFRTCSSEFTLSTVALVAAVVRMLITLVALGNISHVLLNLTKTLTFAMFKDSSSLSLNVHVVNSHIFSLPHLLRLLPGLNFCPLPLSVWLGS